MTDQRSLLELPLTQVPRTNSVEAALKLKRIYWTKINKMTHVTKTNKQQQKNPNKDQTSNHNEKKQKTGAIIKYLNTWKNKTDVTKNCLCDKQRNTANTHFSCFTYSLYLINILLNESAKWQNIYNQAKNIMW